MSQNLKLSHLYTTTSNPPSVDNIIYGEIALSIRANNEKIFIKNSDDNIIYFPSSTYVDNNYFNLNKNSQVISGTTTFKSNVLHSGICTFNNECKFLSKGIINAYKGIDLNLSTSTLNISGSTIIDGSLTSSSGFYDTSDEKLKNFSKNINVNFEQLKKLRKFYFTFKNDVNEKSHIGVSAQEIKNIFPEIVNENNEGYLTVDYSKLSVIALAAIDKLNEKCENIEKRLQKIEEKLGCN